MSCSGRGYGTSSQSNDYLYSQFYSSIVNTSIISKSGKKCRKFKGFYPNFTPSLIKLSKNTSIRGEYSLVYITGENFLPNGTTFIKFDNYGYLPATYYSSFNISFNIPLNAIPGNYNVKIVNLYNGNFSRSVNQSYPGILNFSNSLLYTVT